ncbi:MAG: GNAT family N-acetyltransferase [bacterium]
MRIRPLAPEDLPSVQEIYAHHVLQGTGTWEWEPPSLEEMQARAHNLVNAGLPYLIADVEGQIAGYAYAGPFRPRTGYRHTLEDSVYLHPGFTGQGLGPALLRELVRRCAALGYREMIAVIGDSANQRSIRMHEKVGFVEVGVLKNVGFKFERFLDSVYMQVHLNPPGRV